jgi:hypothetical protein
MADAHAVKPSRASVGKGIAIDKADSIKSKPGSFKTRLSTARF